jgi:hypothetical protein
LHPVYAGQRVASGPLRLHNLQFRLPVHALFDKSL